MNWDAVAAIGEMLGSAAVLVTLIYLSVQVSQTNKISKAAVSRELQQRYYDLYALIATDPEVRGLVTRMQDPEYQPGGPEEEEQVEAFCLMLSGIWLSTGSAYEQGQIDSVVYQVYFDDVAVKLHKWPGLRPWLRKLSESYPAGESFEIIRAMRTRVGL